MDTFSNMDYLEDTVGIRVYLLVSWLFYILSEMTDSHWLHQGQHPLRQEQRTAMADSCGWQTKGREMQGSSPRLCVGGDRDGIRL